MESLTLNCVFTKEGHQKSLIEQIFIMEKSIETNIRVFKYRCLLFLVYAMYHVS